MGTRHKARELAIQALYQLEVKGEAPKEIKEMMGLWESLFRGEVEAVGADREFTFALLDGCYRNLKEIDGLIEKHSTHWKLPRMAIVDRNILRLAVYELLYTHETPTNVVLDEAIELGKKFGTVESGSFINGILDHVAQEVRP